MFIFVLFISSTGLAIVAEADLLYGIFLSEKSCRHKLVVSISFWSWLLSASSVLTSLEYAALLFSLLMRCWYADCSWDFWVLDFVIYVSEICLFLCSSLMRFFVVQICSFSRTTFDEFIVDPIINST